jgi:hypothetical protein
MITQSESGLTEARYNELLAARQGASKQYTLQRINFNWENMGGNQADMSNFDVVSATGYIVLAYWETPNYLTIVTIDDSNNVVQRYKAAVMSGSGLDYRHISLGVNPSNKSYVRIVYRYSDTEVRSMLSTDSGVNWGTNTVVASGKTGVTCVASANHSVCYYTTYSAPNTQFHRAYWDTAWYNTDDDYRYPGEIQSIAVQKIDNDRDLVLIVATGADRYNVWDGTRTAGGEWGPMQGIWSMVRETSGLFSGQYSVLREVDVVDVYFSVTGEYYTGDIFENFTEYHCADYRTNVRLTQFDGRYVATYYAQDHGHAELCYSESENGRHWTLRQPLGDGIAFQGGGCLFPRGNYAWIVEKADRLRSPGTVITGNSQNDIDITDDILEFSISQDDVRSLSMHLANASGTYTTLVTDTNRYRIVEKLGYYTASGETLVQTGIYYLESATWYRTDQGENDVLITGRDILGQLADWVISPEVELRDSQYVFANSPMVLGKVVTVEGVWDCNNPVDRDSTLVLLSNDQPGTALIAGNSILGDLEASLLFAFPITGSASEEFAGFIFHSDSDGDNGLCVYYDLSDDKVHLAKRIGGVTTILQSGSTLGWSKGEVDPNIYGIRIRARGNHIRVYTCNNPYLYTTYCDWTDMDWDAYLNGVVAATDSELQPEGYIGLIGQGYSDEDTLGLRFWSVHITDACDYVSLADAIQMVGSLGGALDWEMPLAELSFAHEDSTATYQWTPSPRNLDVYPGGGSGTLYWAYSNEEFNNKEILIEFDTTNTTGAFIFCAGYNGDNTIDPHRWIAWTSTTISLNGLTIPMTELPLPVSLSGVLRFRVAVKRFEYTADYVVSVWINDQLVLTAPFVWGEKRLSGSDWANSPEREHNFIGFGAYGPSGTWSYVDITFPELHENCEAVTFEPGQSLVGTMRQILGNRVVSLYSRYSGTVHVMRPRAQTVDIALTDDDVESLAITMDRRALRSHWRKVGAFESADKFSDVLLSKIGHVAQVDYHPWLLTRADCENEAQKALDKAVAYATTAEATMPLVPFLEPEDRLDITIGTTSYWTLVGYSAVQMAGKLECQARLRGYA